MGLPFSSRLRRLAVLIWKNTILVRKRHWIITLLEVFLPLMLFTLIAVIRANSSGFGDIKVDRYSWFEPSDQLFLRNSLREKEIHFAPKNNFTETLMRRVNSFTYDQEAGGNFLYNQMNF